MILLGATQGMGRALARRMAERGDSIALLGRHAGELERSARDLEARGAPSPIASAPCDLREPDGFETSLARAAEALGGVDTVVVSAGLFATQEALEEDSELCRSVLDADFTGTVLFCEAARRMLLGAGGGTLCVFSSVAGDRGRSPVVLYGAAKAGLSRYLEGLDHRFARRGLRVVDVRPGFVHTAMTAGLPAPPFAGTPDQVADTVLRALDRGTPVVYAPPIWRWILWAVRAIPRTLMRRLSF